MIRSEEKTFIEDVIDKGLMDGSGYGYSKITVNGEKFFVTWERIE